MRSLLHIVIDDTTGAVRVEAFAPTGESIAQAEAGSLEAALGKLGTLIGPDLRVREPDLLD